MSRADRILAGAILLVALLLACWLAARHYGAAQFDAGAAAAIAERAQADADAVLARTRENAALAARQDEINTSITKEKDDEIANLRSRLAAAGRLRVGTAVCPDRPAPAAEAPGAAGSDGTDSPIGLVSERTDADFKQLILDVETDLATGRACQAFVRQNELEP